MHGTAQLHGTGETHPLLPRSPEQEIRQATGAHVQVEKEMLPGSTERPCVISGALLLLTAPRAAGHGVLTLLLLFLTSPTGTPEAVAQSIFHISCIMIQVQCRFKVVLNKTTRPLNFFLNLVEQQVPAKGPQTQYQPGSAAVMHGAYGGAGAAAVCAHRGAVGLISASLTHRLLFLFCLDCRLDHVLSTPDFQRGGRHEYVWGDFLSPFPHPQPTNPFLSLHPPPPLQTRPGLCPRRGHG